MGAERPLPPRAWRCSIEIIPFPGRAAEENPYDAFAWFYDRHWAEIFAEAGLTAVETLLLPHIPICGRVLDLCCGTGRLAAELDQRRYRVVGLDSSGEMLGLARRRSSRVPWVRADARSFALRPCFDAATCLFDSVNHLLSADELRAAFTSVRGCLRPGGLFLFDVNTDLGFRERWVREWNVATGDGECRLVGAYEPDLRMGTYHFTLLGRGTDAWRVAEFEFRERCHSDREIRGALAEAGLSVVEVCDAVEGLEVDGEIGRDFYLCHA